MPNWVEEKLKIRGKPEDIKRWVEECLHCYTTNWLGDGAHTELVKGAVRFERDPDSEEMYLYVDKSAHIEGTRRNFVEKGEYQEQWLHSILPKKARQRKNVLCGKKRYESTSSRNVILAERVCGSNTARAGSYAGRNAYWRTGRA